MDSVTFFNRLLTAYGGEVIAIERYQNYRSTIIFHCRKCSYTFYACPDYILKDDDQRHVCFKNQSFGIGKDKAIKKKLLKREEKEIRMLLGKDESIYYIGKKMKLNASTVRYFIEN